VQTRLDIGLLEQIQQSCSKSAAGLSNLCVFTCVEAGYVTCAVKEEGGAPLTVT
jgi:hypothetical protein